MESFDFARGLRDMRWKTLVVLKLKLADKYVSILPPCPKCSASDSQGKDPKSIFRHLNKGLQTISFMNHNTFRSVNSSLKLGLCSISSFLHPSFLFSLGIMQQQTGICSLCLLM